jgi:uncharacterized protein (DUF2267 family)
LGPRLTSATRIEGRTVSYRELISAVQAAGAMETPGEAERAVLAVLGELAGCVTWPLRENLAACLPGPLRKVVSRRSFQSSMSRFSPPAFLRAVAEQERVDRTRAAHDTRAVLLVLDQTLPGFLTDQLHSELASLWGPLTTELG